MHEDRFAALPDDVDALQGAGARAGGAARNKRSWSSFERISRIEQISDNGAQALQFGRSSEKSTARSNSLSLVWRNCTRRRRPCHRGLFPFCSGGGPKPVRRPLPEHLPREEIMHAAACACPKCGGELRRLGEDVTEVLEHVPASFKVDPACAARSSPVGDARPSPRRRCLRCPSSAAAPDPGCWPMCWSRNMPTICRFIARARFTPAKASSWSVPRWPTGSAARRRCLHPLVDALAQGVMASDVLHGDDTPVPVLAPEPARPRPDGCGPMSAMSAPWRRTPPAAVFFYSPDRKGARLAVHLKRYEGCAACRRLCRLQCHLRDRHYRRAACWAHYPEQSFIWRTGALRRICRGIVGPGSRHKIRAMEEMRAGSVLASKVLDEQVRFRRASRTSAGRRASSSSWL